MKSKSARLYKRRSSSDIDNEFERVCLKCKLGFVVFLNEESVLAEIRWERGFPS